MRMRRGNRSRVLIIAAVATALGTVSAFAAPAGAAPATEPSPHWQPVSTGSTSHFRALSVVSRKVVWLGGYDGTVLRTVNGGKTWQNVSPAGASTLQFRDIQASSARHAVAMAAGTATDSRLYETDNGGKSWKLAYTNHNAAAFFDCMSFSNARQGLVLSDPVNGKFRILATSNGGHSWKVLPSAGMPTAASGEYGFAASGECLTTSGHDAWFGGGGATKAQIFHSGDGGYTWHVSVAPIVSSASAGVNGLAFRTADLGIAVGGDYAAPTAASHVAAVSDFHQPWSPAGGQPSGYRSGVTFVPHTLFTAVAVGLNGSDVSFDAGHHWTTFDGGSFDTVSCAHDGSCWASGDLGHVAQLRGL
jgi:photosystem II stability/assembly factor-like uncharacterized protein